MATCTASILITIAKILISRHSNDDNSNKNNDNILSYKYIDRQMLKYLKYIDEEEIFVCTRCYRVQRNTPSV